MRCTLYGMSDSSTPTTEGVPVAVLAHGGATDTDLSGQAEQLRSYPLDPPAPGTGDRLPAVITTEQQPGPTLALDYAQPDRSLSSFGAEPGRRYRRQAPAIALAEGVPGSDIGESPLQFRRALTVAPPLPQPTLWRRLARLGPAPEVLRRHQTRSIMQTMLNRPVTIVMAQPKGGAGKTPTAIGIASAIGAARGGDVCAWDNSEVRGTLALRVPREPHERSVADLLTHLSWYEENPAMLPLEWLMHRQDAGFRVLATDPLHASRDDNLDDPTWLSGSDFRRIHSVLTRFFPVLVVDNGQSELANWRASIDVADVIVVPLKLRQDHLNLAAEMINDLRRSFSQRERAALEARPDLDDAARSDLHDAYDPARRIMIVVSNGDVRPEPGVANKAADWFGGFRSIQVPFDKALDREAPITWQDLRQGTKDAYDRIGATAVQMATTTNPINRIIQPTPEQE